MWLDWNLSDTIKFLEIGVWVIYPNNIYGSGNLLDSILSSGSGFKTCTLATTTDSSWVDPFVPFPVLPLCFNLPSPMVSQIYGLFGIRDLLRYCRCRVTWVTQPDLLLLVMGMDLQIVTWAEWCSNFRNYLGLSTPVHNYFRHLPGKYWYQICVHGVGVSPGGFEFRLAGMDPRPSSSTGFVFGGGFIQV